MENIREWLLKDSYRLVEIVDLIDSKYGPLEDLVWYKNDNTFFEEHFKGDYIKFLEVAADCEDIYFTDDSFVRMTAFGELESADRDFVISRIKSELPEIIGIIMEDAAFREELKRRYGFNIDV